MMSREIEIVRISDNEGRNLKMLTYTDGSFFEPVGDPIIPPSFPTTIQEALDEGYLIFYVE